MLIYFIRMSDKDIVSNEVLNNNELVYTRDNNGHIQSAGYSINSELMKSNIPLIETLSKNFSNTKQSGGKVSERFKELAIPVGLLLMNQKPIHHYTQSNSDEIIDDTLYNKLLLLASDNTKDKNVNKKRKTKHNKHNKSNKKTKKRNKKIN